MIKENKKNSNSSICRDWFRFSAYVFYLFTFVSLLVGMYFLLLGVVIVVGVMVLVWAVCFIWCSILHCVVVKPSGGGMDLMDDELCFLEAMSGDKLGGQ